MTVRHSSNEDGQLRHGSTITLTDCYTVAVEVQVHGQQSDTMALITSDCDAMHSSSIKWP